MARTYPRLVGANKIKDEYGKINTIAQYAEETEARVDTILSEPDPNKDPELVDIRTPDSSYTPQRTISVAGDMTRDMQAQFVTHKADLLSRAINVKYPPESLTAATGDGSADDQPAIQAIIDYAALHDLDVYLPSGTYALGDTLKRKGRVSIYGQSMHTTILKFTKVAGGTVIDTVNEPLHGVTLQDFRITKDAAVTGGVTGILGGSTIELYNSAIGVFRNIRISGLTNGITGNGEPSGVGIFDSLFENIFIDNCFNGIRVHGSGNVLIHPRIVKCSGSGLSLEYLNGESMAGIAVFNGVFVENVVDINVPHQNGIRPCSFHGTWFEQSVNGLINIPNAGTVVMSLAFRDCMLSTSSTTSLINFFNAVGSIRIDNCTLAQVAGSSVDITPPSSPDGVLKISNAYRILSGGSLDVYSQTKNSPWITATLLNSWIHASEPGTVTKYWKDDNNVVHLQIGMKDGEADLNTIVFVLPNGYRPAQSVRFVIYDVTNNAVRNMYVNTNGNVAIGASGYSSGVWAGYVCFRADQ